MVESDSGKNQSESLERQTDHKVSLANRGLMVRRKRWRPIAAVSSLAALFGSGSAAIWWFSNGISDLALAVAFIVGSSINLGLLIAVVAQAFIYWGQRNIMNESLGQNAAMLRAISGQLDEMKTNTSMQAAITDPRLRVSVHAEDFDPGRKPVFVVTVTNDGLISATNVAFEMVVKWLGREERRRDVFDVPAKESETQHLVSNGVLTDSQFDSFNESAPLIVEGSLSYFPYQKKGDDPPQRFCYKYRPWKGDRRGMQQFIRCSSSTNVDIGLRLEGVGATAVAGSVTPIKQPPETKPEGEKENPN